MDIFNSINSVLNNPAAQSLIQGLAPKPAPKKEKAAVIQVQSPVQMPAPGLSKGAMIGIGAGVLALVAILIFSFKRK